MSLDYAPLRKALRRLTASRSLVEQFYERAVNDLPPIENQIWLKSFKVAAFTGRAIAERAGHKPNPTDTRDALAQALLTLNHLDAIFDLLATAIAEGLFDPTGADTATAESRRNSAFKALKSAFATQPAPLAAAADLAAGELQKATHHGETFAAPERMIPAFLLAKKRICRIQTYDRSGSPVTGTGFLIGPSAVLTNYHVIESKIDDDDIELTVMFDFSQLTATPTSNSSVFNVSRENGRKDWYSHLSPTGKEVNDTGQPGWWNVEDDRSRWINRHGAWLDYAVLTLQGAPGLQRGWYDLLDLKKPAPGVGCVVMQHPEGHGFAHTSGRLHFSTRTNRLFHSASTKRGSSGGLVIDVEGRPVGLHYLGLGLEARAGQANPRVPDEVVNVAIPLTQIAAHLGRDNLAALQTPPPMVPHLGCLQGGHPLFGRQRLLEELPKLATGEKQILWVQPPPQEVKFVKPGKSFTTDILKTLFPEKNNLFLSLSADSVPVDDRQFASILIEALSGAPPATLPESATTDAAFDSDLATAVATANSAGGQKHLVWLVIDELDKVDIPHSGGARFLDRLYSRVADISRLRIVLIGMHNRRQIPDKPLVHDIILENDVSQIKAMFAKWLDMRTAGGQPIDPNVTNLLGELAESFAGRTAPLATISEFVVTHLLPPLSRYVDR